MDYELNDEFEGTDLKLVECTKALLAMDKDNALVPQGLCGHSRSLLNALASRLEVMAKVMEHVDPASVPGLTLEDRVSLSRYAKPFLTSG